jgi:hypothetical protein
MKTRPRKYLVLVHSLDDENHLPTSDESALELGGLLGLPFCLVGRLPGDALVALPLLITDLANLASFLSSSSSVPRHPQTSRCGG